MAALSVALLLTAAPAGAFVSGEFGLQQRKPVWLRHGPLQYHGGPVIHASEAYAIYWDPLELYNSQWTQLIDEYFRNDGAASGTLGNVFALDSQYGETGYSTQPSASATAKEAHAADQSTFRGAYTDTEPYPTGSEDCHEAAELVCLTDKEIKAELQKVIKSGALPGATGTVPGAKSTPVYYILTPPGVTVCTGAGGPGACSNSTQLEHEASEIKEGKIDHPAETGICGYHSTIEPHGAKPIVYAVQPWIAGDAGLFVESWAPVTTSGTSAGVLACQDNSVLEEPNQLSGLNPFAAYGAGLADVIVGDLADEQANIAVDPLVTSGWYQNAAAEEGGYPEQGDMCQWNFGPPPETPPTPNPETHAASTSNEELGSGKYYLHWGFNSSAPFTPGEHKVDFDCWQGVDLEPHITAPNPVNVGDVVGLDANESGITLDAAPLSLRQGKEETRLAEEVAALGDEESNLAAEIAALGVDIAKLDTEKTKSETEVTKLGNELAQLAKEEERVAKEQENLALERQEAEEKEELTPEKSKEIAGKENAVAEERKRITEAKATAATNKKAAEEHIKEIEAKVSTDKARQTTLGKDKIIVAGDKQIAEKEQKLAGEHKLIKESEPLLAPIYKWDFGYQENGHEVTEEGEEKASVFHTFPCAKTYTVDLTVLDGGGNPSGLPESVVKTIEVVGGKPCEESSSGGGSGSETGSGPSSTPGASSTSTSGSSSSSTNPATSTSTAKTPGPAPVASAAAVPSSLAKTTKKGLVVSYLVNQQVAGHFEVLLAAQVAHRIGLHLPLATGLPAGTPAQVVIGKAILITTKGGRGAVKIQFGKVTGRRLRRLGKVSLMLRLNVRNASGGTTTVLSTFTLR
jgi:hypothetical protein